MLTKLLLKTTLTGSARVGSKIDGFECTGATRLGTIWRSQTHEAFIPFSMARRVLSIMGVTKAEVIVSLLVGALAAIGVYLTGIFL